MQDLHAPGTVWIQVMTYGGGSVELGKLHEAGYTVDATMYMAQWWNPSVFQLFDTGHASFTVSPGTEQWAIDGDALWNAGSSWTSNIVPDGVDAVANFLEQITSDRTVTVDLPVTVGTISFDNVHSYTLAGPAEITLQTSSGDARINVLKGSHTISSPVSLAGGLTVDTAAETTLTFGHGSPRFVIGGVTKEGLGRWVLDGGILPLGEINVNNGTLQVRKDLLAMPGGEVNIAAGGTLKTGGAVNRRVVGAPGSTLEATGAMDVGVLDDAHGYDFQGRLTVGPHMVGLKDANLAELYGAQLAGGTLSSFNGIQVQPFVPSVPTSMVQGSGTINGNVTLSRPGAGFAVIRGTSGLLPITMTGTVNGNAVMVNVIRTGLYKPGFSPTFLPESPPEADYGANTQVQLLGPNAGKIHGLPGFSNPKFNFGLETGDYTQFCLSMDPTSSYIPVTGPFLIYTFDPNNPSVKYSPKAGDQFQLLVTGPFEMFLSSLPPANLTYPDPTGASLFKFDNANLGPGLEWKWQLSPTGLTLMVIPEPGTGIPEPGTLIPEPGTLIPEPGTSIPEPGTLIPEPGMVIPEPGTSIPDPGTLTPEPGTSIPEPGTSIPEPGTMIPEPGMVIPEPGMVIPEPGTSIPDPRTLTPEPGTSIPEPGTSIPEPGTLTPEPGTSIPEPGY